MLRSEINIRDPFVLVHDGVYYLYGTRGATCWGAADGFDVYVSRDLENFDGPTACFENDGTFYADRNYWAPEVHEYKGAFYMFASFKNATMCRGTAILRADTPMGPFIPWSDGPVTPRDWECLDGTFHVDEQGVPYMVFCHEWVQVGDGTICALQLTDDLRAPVGEPRVLFSASEVSWGKVVRNSQGCEGYVTDGPFLWRLSTGELVCLWASFSETGYTEAQAMSESGTVQGPWKQVEPLFWRDGGHGMVFRDLQGRLMLTLHSPNEHLLERPCFYPIEERDGVLCAI